MRDIAHTAASDSGRDLPDSDAASEEWVERLAHLRGLGVEHFIMDFGHPLDVEPALRFAEQAIAPMKAD